jgi:hypothetical protein
VSRVKYSPELGAFVAKGGKAHMGSGASVARGRHRMEKVCRQLVRRMRETMAQEDAEVTVRDLLVRYAPLASKGEYQDILVLDAGVERLQRHIQALFCLANADHEKHYCEKSAEGKVVTRKGCENKLTRLVMNEFSLYTKEPLTVKQFRSLVEFIENEARQLAPNVHIQLGSLAFRDYKHDVVNATLYVQAACGASTPSVRVIAKNTPSLIDPRYPDGGLFAQCRGVSGHGVAPAFASEAAFSRVGFLVSTANVFTARTAGGARFVCVLDVCLDHSLGHGFQQTLRWLKQADERVPASVEHIISSNTICRTAWHLVGTASLQVDPRVPVAKEGASSKQESVTTAALQAKMPMACRTKFLVMNNGSYLVFTADFGRSFMVETRAPRRLGHIVPQLEMQRAQQNMAYCFTHALAYVQRMPIFHGQSPAMQKFIAGAIAREVLMRPAGKNVWAYLNWSLHCGVDPVAKQAIAELHLREDGFAGERLQKLLSVCLIMQRPDMAKYILDKYPQELLRRDLAGRTIMAYAAGSSPKLWRFIWANLPLRALSIATAKKEKLALLAPASHHEVGESKGASSGEALADLHRQPVDRQGLQKVVAAPAFVGAFLLYAIKAGQLDRMPALATTLSLHTSSITQVGVEPALPGASPVVELSPVIEPTMAEGSSLTSTSTPTAPPSH